MITYFKSTNRKTLRTESDITYVAKIRESKSELSVICEIYPKNLTKLIQENGSEYFPFTEKMKVVEALKKDGFVICDKFDYDKFTK